MLCVILFISRDFVPWVLGAHGIGKPSLFSVLLPTGGQSSAYFCSVSAAMLFLRLLVLLLLQVLAMGRLASDEQLDLLPDYSDPEVARRLKCSACKVCLCVT